MSRTVVSTASSPGSLILANRSGTFRRRERLCLTGGRALCSDWGGRRIICSSIAAHPKIFSDGLSSLDRNVSMSFLLVFIILPFEISVLDEQIFNIRKRKILIVLFQCSSH